MRTINRRESPRIDIELRCHVTSPALWVQSAMYTENISRGGILVAWRGPHALVPMPGIGQILTIEIELPASHGFGRKCIHCQGTVTRVSDGQPDGPRVALQVNYMDFRSFQDRLRTLAAEPPGTSSWMA
ncbi:MAG: PilZ domain-containing protein [Acidobacteriia bacterium]|nr:PilZ domain-containing protein [Terriglobia bacterium]